jgi:hypothetical protein
MIQKDRVVYYSAWIVWIFCCLSPVFFIAYLLHQRYDYDMKIYELRIELMGVKNEI